MEGEGSIVPVVFFSSPVTDVESRRLADTPHRLLDEEYNSWNYADISNSSSNFHQ